MPLRCVERNQSLAFGIQEALVVGLIFYSTAGHWRLAAFEQAFPGFEICLKGKGLSQ